MQAGEDTAPATLRIASDVEVIAIRDVHRAFDRTMRSDVKYRFVIDMASLKA